MKLDVLLLGGGTRVPVHLGAVAACEDVGAQAAAWAGVSGGSIVASVLASGFSREQALKLMLDCDFKAYFDSDSAGHGPRRGLCSGRRFEQWLDVLLAGRRFRDLDVPLAVVATDVATGTPFIFSNQTTPDIKLATAVRCSISLPGIFAVPHVNGRALLDGGFTDIQPQMLFPNSKQPSLVVRLEETQPATRNRSRTHTATGDALQVVELVLRNLKGLRQPDQWDHHVCVPVGDTSGLKFDLTGAEKRDLFDRGYARCRTVLREVMPVVAGPHDSFLCVPGHDRAEPAPGTQGTAVLAPG